jgi:hypothetical protein
MAMIHSDESKRDAVRIATDLPRDFSSIST